MRGILGDVEHQVKMDERRGTIAPGAHIGAMIVYLTGIMPAGVWTSGSSPAYGLATAVFGGSTPAVVHSLIRVTGNQATSGPWSSIAAARGLVAAILAPRSRDAISKAEISYRARPMIHPVPVGG